MRRLQVRLHQSAPIPLDVQFECDQGELLALVGPSGSGKTTTLRAIAGLAPVASGRIEVGDAVWFDAERGLWLAPQQRRVGLVFQSYALFPHLTAAQNIALASAREDTTLHAQELLRMVKLEGFGDRRPSQLSGGQQQRVALARALAREPDVLLLDEPFSAVDQVTRQDLYVELAALRRSLAVPIVLVTHDLREAQRLADRIAILDGGITLQSGTPHEVLAAPRNARVAHLLGLHNHFEGIFYRSDDKPGWGTLLWGTENGGVRLPVIDKGRIDDGARVTWIVPGDCLGLSFGSEADAALSGTVMDAVRLGEVTLCTVQLDAAPRPQVVVAVPSQRLRGEHVQERRVALHLEVSGIHIMPVRNVPHEKFSFFAA